MKMLFSMALVGLAILLSQSVWAREPGQGKLDLVLKCESDDKKFSEIVNLRNDAFAIWDANDGTFVQRDCNAVSRFADGGPHEYETGSIEEGLKASCVASPGIYKYERLYFKYGCVPNIKWYRDMEYPAETLAKIIEGKRCPIERPVESFSVDRKTARFRYITGSAGPDGGIDKDIIGSCVRVERPKPPATKF